MIELTDLKAMEILDSRGRPTLWARVKLGDGSIGEASIPSGRSTGAAEALELRDGDAKRYQGLGCLKARDHVNHDIRRALLGQSFPDASAIDQAMIDLDGTANKSRLGANAILAVSIAAHRASAAALRQPLYEYFAGLLGRKADSLPRMTINLFSGGKHAGGQVPIQDVLIVPVSARTIEEGLAMTYAVYRAAAADCMKRYQMRDLTADEGGLAPPFACARDMLTDAVRAIENAGYHPGSDIAIAIDVASSHFHHKNLYHMDGRQLDSSAMIDQVIQWVTEFPIVSVEDALAEDDWDHWPLLRQAMGERTGDKALVLGDDLLCTNPGRITRAVETSAANALLLKVNQIGSLSEAAQANQLARDAGWRVTISARSGETEDNWLADLAVGWGGDQIKVGSITQSERLAKYNRLLMIEDQTKFPVVAWPGKTYS
jgi:enolase